MPKSQQSVSAAEVPTPPKTYRIQAVAKLLQVSQRTAQKLVDSGTLRGHRIPGSRYRKVYEPDLVKFLLEHNLWVPPEMAARYRQTHESRV